MKKNTNPLVTALLLTLICALCGGLVAAVYHLTAKTIQENREKESQKAPIEGVISVHGAEKAYGAILDTVQAYAQQQEGDAL